MVKRRRTVDEVYDWASRNDVPAPDAFAVSYLSLAGHPKLLHIAAVVWRRRVAARKTGFPAIDQGE